MPMAARTIPVKQRQKVNLDEKKRVMYSMPRSIADKIFLAHVEYRVTTGEILRQMVDRAIDPARHCHALANRKSAFDPEMERTRMGFTIPVDTDRRLRTVRRSYNVSSTELFWRIGEAELSDEGFWRDRRKPPAHEVPS